MKRNKAIKWSVLFTIALIVIMAPTGNTNATSISTQDSTRQDLSNMPLFLVDKKILEAENKDELSRKLDLLLPIIKSMIVLKDASTVSKYGEKGKNGVIFIKLIKGKKKRRIAIAEWKKKNPEWPNMKKEPIPANTIWIR